MYYHMYFCIQQCQAYCHPFQPNERNHGSVQETERASGMVGVMPHCLSREAAQSLSRSSCSLEAPNFPLFCVIDRLSSEIDSV